MKVSVIIPAYNVSDYLGECLDSIINQTYRNLEIIVVNDGSTDNSREIIRRYESDSRVAVIDKPNGGLSEARNAGVNRATGDLITFVDGDDIISSDSFERNVQFFIEDPFIDMIQYPVMFHWTNNCQYLQKSKHQVLSGDEVFHYWWKNSELIYSVCNKMFRRSVFGLISFPVGRCFEDMYILPDLSRRINKAIISEKGIYYYRFREGSILNSALSYPKHKDQLDAMFRIYTESFQYEMLKPERAEFWINVIWWQFYSLHHYEKIQQKRSIEEIDQRPLSLSDFISGHLSAKNRFRIIVFHLLGFRLMFNLFQIWKKILLR